MKIGGVTTVLYNVALIKSTNFRFLACRRCNRKIKEVVCVKNILFWCRLAFWSQGESSNLEQLVWFGKQHCSV
jgi:hypothetical protein